MIHELRCYHSMPGRKVDLLRRFATGTLALFERHGFKLLFFWDRPDEDELWYVLEWRSHEAMYEAWETFKKDESWATLKSTSEAQGPLVKTVESIVLAPLPAWRP